MAKTEAAKVSTFSDDELIAELERRNKAKADAKAAESKALFAATDAALIAAAAPYGVVVTIKVSPGGIWMAFKSAAMYRVVTNIGTELVASATIAVIIGVLAKRENITPLAFVRSMENHKKANNPSCVDENISTNDIKALAKKGYIISKA